jgi:dolichyl-phosphate-mannose-protein mannosyltransferase
MSFWSKFVELHREMVRANSQLINDHPYASFPGSWPWVMRGVSYWQGSGPDAVRQGD